MEGWTIINAGDIQMKPQAPHECQICGELGPPGKLFCQRHLAMLWGGKTSHWMRKQHAKRKR